VKLFAQKSHTLRTGTGLLQKQTKTFFAYESAIIFSVQMLSWVKKEQCLTHFINLKTYFKEHDLSCE